MRIKRRKLKLRRILIAFILAAFLIFEVISTVSNILTPEENRTNNAQIASHSPAEEKNNENVISTDNLYSQYAILVCLDDHKILMEKNSEKRIYPASLTKIMTAVVAIENLPDLKKKILLNGGIFEELRGKDASVAGFLPNEKVSVLDLLYGALLPSGAECCIGLAEAAAGSEQNFVQLMNNKAKEIGLVNTHFENTTGLHDPNHYTTVKDISILLQYALKNSTFTRIFTASRHSTESTNRHPGGITLTNTMFESMANPAIDGGEILGGKTGYTDQAGLCLASLAEKGGKEYILVTAGANGNHQSEKYNIIDAVAVYDELGK